MTGPEGKKFGAYFTGYAFSGIAYSLLLCFLDVGCF